MTNPNPVAPVFLRPEPDSRLDHLTARFDELKARADAAAAEFDDLKLAIKAELQANGGPRMCDDRPIIVESPNLQAPLRVSVVVSWQIDAKRLKAEAPEVYVRWAVQKRPTIKLERVRG